MKKNSALLCMAWTLVLVMMSCTSYKYLDKNEIEKNTDAYDLAEKLSSKNQDSIPSVILRQGLGYLFTHLKYEHGKEMWKKFQSQLLSKNVSVEEAMMNVYDESLYTIGIALHYDTEYPYEYGTSFEVGQGGFVNVQFIDSISLRDKEKILYMFDYFCDTIQTLLLDNPDERNEFTQKLDLMNDGYFNVELIANEYMILNRGLKHATGSTSTFYRYGSRTFDFQTIISSKYLNSLSSITFMHELVHAVLRLNAMPIEHLKVDRNNVALRDSINRERQPFNVMLEEGLAEYISRNYNIWDSKILFESVHKEMIFLKKKNGFSLLSLKEMEEFYYGRRKASFTYVEYGLTSAHSLVDFMVEEHGLQKTIAMVHETDAEKAAPMLLEKQWSAVIKDWQNKVENISNDMQ
jgi:hypothetical protein